MELEALQESLAHFSETGARLVAISPQQPEFNQKLQKAKKLTFDILSDPGNKAASDFGLVFTFPDDLKQLYQKFGIDVARHNGDDSWTLPIPARFIIDPQGIIRYAEADPDYTVRPEPEHTLEALRSLQS